MAFLNPVNSNLWGIAKGLRHWFLISTCKGSNPFTPRMINYYNNLLNKKKLLNLWTFSGGQLKGTFLITYGFIFCFYKKKVFFEYNNCITVLKKFFPVLHSTVDNKSNILFVGTNCLYSQSFFSLKSNYISKSTIGKVGSFTNFVTEGFKFFMNKKLHKNSSVVIFFNFSLNNFLILESKKKNIPSIALVNSISNPNLLDYPIFLNSFYFHNVYFFSRLIFKYILRLI
jgi:ribosomal protein S2